MEKPGKILISEEQIRRRIAELGEQITQQYKGRSIHVIGVLKGAFMFMSDLVRVIDLPMTIDFLSISSYGNLTKSSGVVSLLTDLTIPIEGKDVLVVEDIVDTGLTLRYLLDNMKTRNPNSLRVCALLDKPERREAHVSVDYCGFVIPNRFVVGYGLDGEQFLRNLPYIGAMDEG